MINDQIHTIVHEGFELSYSIQGEGPACIVIGSALYYPRVFPRALEEQFKMIYMDQRSFASKHTPSEPSDFELDKLLEDIEVLRIELNLKKFCLVGHSIHGLIAMEYAKRYPDRVSHLVLIACSPISGAPLHEVANRCFAESVCPERKQILAQQLSTLDEAIAREPKNAFITRMLRFAPMIWYDPHFDASVIWEGIELDSIGAERIWNGIFNVYVADNLNHITAPVLLMLGRYDYWNPPHLWVDYRNAFKDLTVRIFELSGHTPSYEEPEDFVNEIMTWYQDKHE